MLPVAQTIADVEELEAHRQVRPELQDAPKVNLGEGTKRLDSPKLTWKWRGAPYKTTIPYIGPFMSFHVNLGEVPFHCRTRSS